MPKQCLPEDYGGLAPSIEKTHGTYQSQSITDSPLSSHKGFSDVEVGKNYKIEFCSVILLLHAIGRMKHVSETGFERVIKCKLSLLQ